MYYFMNKKIYTLLAAGLMGGLSVNAAVTDGKLHQLKVGDKYLSITRTYNNTADSLIMADPADVNPKTYDSDVMSDLFKKSLWKIVKSAADNTVDPVYTLTNYATGKVLSLDLSKADGTIRAGQSTWKITSDKLNAVKAGKTYAIALDGAKVKVVETDAAVTDGQAFGSATATAAVVLNAEQVNGLYGTANVLDFAKSLEGNPLDGVPFQALNEDANGFMNLRLTTGKYLVVDTTKWTNSVNDFSYWKLTTDALPTTAATTAKAPAVVSALLANGRTAEVYKFKLTLNVKDGYVISITPEAVPVFAGNNDIKAKVFCYDKEVTARPLVYGQFASSTQVLAATSNPEGDDKLATAYASFGTPEAPSALDPDYTYYIQDYNKYVHNNNGAATADRNRNYKGYLTSDDCNGSGIAKSTVAIPSNMWYLNGFSLNNMQTNTQLVNAPILLVNEAEGIYAFGTDTLKLTKGPKVKDARKMGYKAVSANDLVNGAASLRLVSGLADDLYVTLSEKDGALYVANGELADAMKLKLDEAYSWEEGNKVARPVYTVTDRMGVKTLTYRNEDGKMRFMMDGENRVWEGDVVYLSFQAVGSDDNYKLVFRQKGNYHWVPEVADDPSTTDVDEYVPGHYEFDYWTENQAITANAATGLLEAASVCDVTKNYIFEFAKKDAPTYGAPKYGHVQITTLEDDNKMIAPQLDGFASLKAEGQILKSDLYTNDTLKLWLDTAFIVDEVAPFYYLSSSAFNEEGDLRNYLFNPYNYSRAIDAHNADLDFDEEPIENPYPFKSGSDWDNYMAYRAAFTPAAVCGEDSLAIFEKDTIDVRELNPAAVAFVVVPEEGDEVYNIVSGLQKKNFDYDPENEDDEMFIDTDEWYLAQLNNVLFWTHDASKAEKFVINRTTAPTANEAVEAETVKVIAGQGVVTVQGAAGKVITVANILGQTIANQVAASDNVTIAAPAGVVVVAVDGEATKVVVK